MQLLYGTGNPAKLKHMREMLYGLDIDIIGLKDISINIDSIDESGSNPLENARIKALTYYKAAKFPVFSCDSGLYIEGLDDKDQPGVYVRRVNGKVLTDEEMIEYYSSVALELGGQARAKYKNAICLVIDENNVFEYDGDSISESFFITANQSSKRNIGFPLDSISLDIETGKYYIDISGDLKSENKLVKGFRDFFIRYLKGIM